MKLVALVLVAALTGCLLKPDKVDVQPADARVQMDAPLQTLSARLIRNAYYDSVGMTPGMTNTGYQISTQGIGPGDLVLFIANIDNGSDTVWALPDDFHQVRQKFFGIDGQTFVVAWHFATLSEPANYSKMYGPGIASAASTISLVAVTGADKTFPINTDDEKYGAVGQSPVVATSNGVTTTVPGCLLVYAAGADWLQGGGANTFEVPAGFTELTSFGDKSKDTWDWTSMMIAIKPQPDTGASGSVSGTMPSAASGIPWAALLAIAPAPQ